MEETLKCHNSNKKNSRNCKIASKLDFLKKSKFFREKPEFWQQKLFFDEKDLYARGIYGKFEKDSGTFLRAIFLYPATGKVDKNLNIEPV